MNLVPHDLNTGRATFCLNMIVRDEAHVIERCLDSVRPLVDYVRIVDTGSTDDTVHLIRAWCLREGVDCRVTSTEWVDFATNRNEALALAGECGASHLILIDADEVLHINHQEVLAMRRMLAETEQAMFTIPMVYGNNICTRTNITRNLPERLSYRFPIHEELVLDGEGDYHLTLIGNPASYTDGPHVTTPQDGARSQAPGRLERDLLALTKAYNEDNNPRHLFYAGQVLRIGAHTSSDPNLWGMVRQAYTQYLRAMAGNYQPHCYVAALWVARIMEMEGCDPDRVIETYLRVHDFDPGRPEAMGCLACLCLDQGYKDKALEFARRVDSCRGSTNYAFLETKWYRKAEEIINQLQEVVC